MPRTIEGEPLTSLPGLGFNSVFRRRVRSFSCVNTELYCMISRATDITMNVTVVRFDQAEKAEHVIKYIKQEPQVKVEEVDESDEPNVGVTMYDSDIEVKEEFIDPQLAAVDLSEQPGEEAVLRFHHNLEEASEEDVEETGIERQSAGEDLPLFDNDQKEWVQKPPDPKIRDCFIRVIPPQYRRGITLRPRPRQIKKTNKKKEKEEIKIRKRRNKTKQVRENKERKKGGAELPDENFNLTTTENFNFTSTGRFVNAPKRYPN